MNLRGAAAYQKVGTQSGAEFATPHRLIQMLLEGALEKMVIAKSYMERDDIAGKSENINWAIRIIGGLQASIDKDKGGEIAETLASLYNYIVTLLCDANIENNVSKIDEAISIINNIKDGWDGISDEADKIHNQQTSQGQ
jgi:flagellar protein FliS